MFLVNLFNSIIMNKTNGVNLFQISARRSWNLMRGEQSIVFQSRENADLWMFSEIRQDTMEDDAGILHGGRSGTGDGHVDGGQWVPEFL